MENKLLEPEPREMKIERLLIKWWRGWYSFGWRGWIAKKLLTKVFNNF